MKPKQSEWRRPPVQALRRAFICLHRGSLCTGEPAAATQTCRQGRRIPRHCTSTLHISTMTGETVCEVLLIKCMPLHRYRCLMFFFFTHLDSTLNDTFDAHLISHPLFCSAKLLLYVVLQFRQLTVVHLLSSETTRVGYVGGGGGTKSRLYR